MSVVFTIGYEGTDIDRFVQTLKTVGVTCLADVRAVPQSRKKGFSKRGLAERLALAGIEYRHLLNLGDPKPGRDAARSGDYQTFRRVYSEHFEGEAAQEAFRELISLASQQVTCLLCFERDPKTCHRSIVADRMVSQGYESFDLYGDDPSRYVRHRSKLPSGSVGEGAPTPQ